MKELNCDIHIVGGALSGLLTAYCAAVLGYRIIISEKKNILLNNKISITDTRTTAIAEGSKIFLESQGLWKFIKPFAEPIKNIKVMDTTAKCNLDFVNPITKSNLGYIVKNSKLISVLIKELQKRKNVNFLMGSSINSILFNKLNNISISNNKKINSKLMIAADGKNSTIRKILGTNFLKKNYYEKALVVNFSHEVPHNNIAYEFFLKTGPLAILPMQKEKNKNLSTLIWSNKPEIVDMITGSNLPEKYLLEILNEKLSMYLGAIQKVYSIQAFPLSAHINEKFYDNKTIYLGDAAHSVHPIAGQGWNLGLRDVKSLTNLLKQARDSSLTIGTEDFCKTYNNLCYYDAYRLFQTTDKLDWIFKKEKFYFRLLKNVGFKVINKNKFLKEKIVEFAMGF
tara:strand:- start:2381 stop:3571 length:1191 start_codon:yes stop_codon:yes gene_type:complete